MERLSFLKNRKSLATVLFLALAGCSAAANHAENSPPVAKVEAATAALTPQTVRLAKGDEKALAALIAGHKGEVVFVDFWATWCLPCVEYFPRTVELSRKLNGKGLAIIAVTFDDADSEAAVREFLATRGADFENLMCSYDLGPAAFEAFGLEQVPHFRLYDRAGKLRQKWDDKPADAEQKIEELLAEKSE